MTTNQQMFLLAAEELSFTRAAARAYVSQQCLSDHIRRLEESYGVRLFDRSPRLRLTAAGETLYRALRQIQVIEHGVQQEFSGEGETAHGTVTLGIQPARARQLLPGLTAAFRAEYPGVRIDVVLGETQRLSPQLLEGKIDLFLGVDTPPHLRLRRELLREEAIFLLATTRLLQEHLPGWDPERTQILPEELVRLPLAFNPAVSTLAQAVDGFMTGRGLRLAPVCTVGDYYIQLSLCRLHQAAAFCPESFLREVFLGNSSCGDQSQVLALRVPGLDSRLRVELVTHTSHYLPRYAAALHAMLRTQYLASLAEVERLMA